MNAVTLRRRWLIARPWIEDVLIALCFIAATVIVWKALDVMAALLTGAAS